MAGRFSPTLAEFSHQGVPGSVEMTTGSTGVISGSLEMDAYSDMETATGNLQWGQTPYRYIGGLNCQSEGLASFGGTGGGSYRLIMMGERWYDPQVGRFISRDPVFSENLYAYCGNNPVNAVDPEGRLSFGFDHNAFGMCGLLFGGGWIFGHYESIGTDSNGDLVVGVTGYAGFITGFVAGVAGGVTSGPIFSTGDITTGIDRFDAAVGIWDPAAGSVTSDSSGGVSIPLPFKLLGFGGGVGAGWAFGFTMPEAPNCTATASFNLSKLYRDTVSFANRFTDSVSRLEHALNESIKDLYSIPTNFR
ncbi:MAG: RHS repeat-associated core domain-containing protein [Armatimonadota bacterium]